MALDSYTLSDVPAATYGPFALLGGVYALKTVSTGSGSISLEAIGPDGSTGILVTAAITATTGFVSPLYLPAGSYKLVISGFSANYVALTGIDVS